MSQGVRSKRLQVCAVLSALVLSACGGGGGSDPVSGNPPAPAPAPGPAPAPSPAPAPAPGVAAIGSDTLAKSNQAYEVRAPSGTAQVVLRLPAQPAVGDTVSLTGVSDTPWELQPNAGQVVLTPGLPGNAQTGQHWTTPNLAPLAWWWLASDAAGDVLAGGENQGQLWISRDGGTTWSATRPDPTGGNGIWIGIDMSADASTMVALEYTRGDAYISRDGGDTWQPIDGLQLTAPPPGRNLEWESASVSQDGGTIALAAKFQPLQVSTDGGRTWSAISQVGEWRGVALSADGQQLFAADHGGDLLVAHRSAAGWTTNAVRPPATTSNGWYRTASSADGQVLVAAQGYTGRDDDEIWLSTDGGTNWHRATDAAGQPLLGSWTTVKVSADGRKIAATGTGPLGKVVLSENGGQSFQVLSVAPGDDNWRSIAMSSDGNMLVAATGGAVGGSPVTGQLHLSRSNRTQVGSLGGIVGGQGDAVQVQYLGNGQYGITSHSGGPFSIR